MDTPESPKTKDVIRLPSMNHRPAEHEFVPHPRSSFTSPLHIHRQGPSRAGSSASLILLYTTTTR